MVAIVAGGGLGLGDTSALTLGGRGVVGEARIGRGSDRTYLNAATGNLVIQSRDELLLGRGLDVAAHRAYNSLGQFDFGNGDNWLSGLNKRIYGLTGAVNTAGSTVKRADWDGTEIVYAYNSTTARYETKGGAGAYDFLTLSASTWTWTDGDSRSTETYDNANGGRITAQLDPSANQITYTYNASGQLTRVQSPVTVGASNTTESVYLDYSGALLTQVRTVYKNASNQDVTRTRVRYEYDASSRLTRVRVDLSPDDNSIATGTTYDTTYTYDGTSKRVASIAQSDGSRLDFVYTQVGADYRVTRITQTAAAGVLRVTNIAYDTVNRTTTLTDALGLVTVFTYDASNRLTRITAPAVGGASQSVQFGYDADGNVTTVTDAKNNVVTYQYNTQGLLTLQRDQAGNTVTRTYNANNQLDSETVYFTPDPDGAGAGQPLSPAVTRYLYDSAHRVRYLLGAEGRVTEYRYDTQGLRTSVHSYTDNLYTATTYTEAALTTWRDALADQSRVMRTDFTYDYRGALASETRSSRVRADGLASLGSTAAEYTNIRYVYDSFGNLLQRLPTVGSSAAEIYAYDGLGRVLSATDLNSALTVSTYDDVNNQTRTTFADGLIRTQVYNNAGELISFLEGQGATTLSTTQYRYDALGRLRYSADPTGVRTHLLYDTASRKVAEIDADGSLTEFFYDANNLITRTLRYNNKVSSANLASLVDVNGNPTAVALATIRPATGSSDRSAWRLYDTANRLDKEVDAAGAVIQYFYDGASRLIRTTAWVNTINLTTFAATPTSANATPTVNATTDRITRYFYDNEGRQRGLLDAEGFIVEQRYNAAGQKVQTVRYADAAATADRAGAALATLIANRGTANRTTDITERFVYDSRGLLRSHFDGEGNRTAYAYDQYGNVSSMNRGRRIDTALLTTPQSVTIEFQARATQSGATWPTVQVRIDGVVVGTVTINSAALTTYSVAATGVVPASNHTIDFVYTNDDGTAGNTTTSRTVWISQGKLKAAGFTQAFNASQYTGVRDTGSGAAAFDGASVTEIDPAAEQLLDVNAALRFTLFQWANVDFTTSSAAYEATTYTYNAYGQLQSKAITLAGGTTETDVYSYDALRRRTSETQASGTAEARTNRVRYDVQGRVVMELGGRGADALAALGGSPTQAQIDAVWTAWAVKYGYDSAGRRVSMTDAIGNKTLYYYNGDGKLTHSIRQASDTAGTVFGEVIEYRYNAFNDLSDTIVYGNRLSATTFNGLTGGLVTTALTSAVTAIANATSDTRTSFEYNTTGTLSTRREWTSSTLNDATTFAYSAFREEASRTRPTDGSNTVVANTGYDRRGLATSTALDSSGLNLTATVVYDAFGRAIQTTDARGVLRTSSYDRAGRMVQVRDGNNQTESMTYDALGNVLTRVDRRGQTTTFAYEPFGRKLTTTTPEGIQTVATYNPHGEVARLQILGVSGNNTVYTYDKDGNLKTSSTASGTLNLVTTNNYDNAGRLISVVDARGTTTTYSYDAANRILTRTVDPSGVNLITRYAYDGKGQTVSVTDPAGTVTTTTYDAKGQKTQVALDPTGLNLRTQFSYDKRGQTLTVTEAAGTADARVTQYIYDKAGRLSRTVVDPATLNIATNYAYDKNGNVATKTDARGSITRYAYDNENRLRFALDPLSALTETVYDAAGNVSQVFRYANFQAAAVISTTSSGGNTSHTINTASIGKDASRDRVTTNAYDKDSRRTFERDALGGLTQFKYDAAGNLLESTQYANRISTTAAPIINGFSGVTISPNATLDRTTRFAYDEANRRIFTLDALGFISENAYDANGNVTKTVGYRNAVSLTGNPSVATVRAAVTPLVDAANDRVVRSAYDRADRAVYRIDSMGFAKKAEYDALGRVTRSLHYIQSITVTDADTVATIGAKLPATPDANTQVTRNVYDRGGRLTDVFEADGAAEVTVTRSVYNALGQSTDVTRGFGTAAASTTRRVYDKAGRVAAEIQGFGSTEAATTRFGYDALGNTTSVVDPRGVELAETDTTWARAERKALGYIDGSGNGKLAATLTPAEQQALRDRYTARSTFDTMGRRTTQTDPLGGQTITVFDAFGDAVKVTDPRGNSGYFYFDRLNQNTLYVDPEGFVVVNTFDSFGGKASTTQHYSRAQRTWTTLAPPVVVSTAPATGAYVLIDAARDATVSYEFDRAGRVTKRTDAENVFGTGVRAYETFGYDAFGNRTSFRNKLGGTTTYSYDRRGLVLTESLPINTKNGGGATIAVVNRYAYDARGNKTQATEAEGAVEQRITTFTYDRLDRLVSTRGQALTTYRSGVGYTSNVTPTTSLTYDARGNLTSQTDPNGNRTAWYYDALSRKMGEVTAAGTLTEWQYDRVGNATNQRIYADPVTLPAGATRPPPVNAANFRETQYKFDANSRQIESRVVGLVLGRQNQGSGQYEIGAAYGLDKSVVTRKYDASGNLVKVVDGNGGATYMFYDRSGRKILEVDPEGYGIAWTRGLEETVSRETRFARRYTSAITETSNAATLLSTWPSDAADRITDFVYDRVFRVVTESRLNVAYGSVNSTTGALTESTGASVQSYAYNALGGKLQQTDANGRITNWTFDLAGRLTKEQLPTFTDFQNASVRTTTDYEYDGLNNVTRVIRRGKDGATETDDSITRLTYGIGGRFASQTDAIGQITNFSYDAGGNLTLRTFQRRDADSVAITDGSVHTYDAVNREISRQTTWQSGVQPWQFGDRYETRYNAYGDVTGRRANGGGAGAAWQEVAEYNALGKAWKTNSGNGITKIFLYDASGNATLSIESSGTDLTALTLDQVLARTDTYRTITVFDKRNQVVRIAQPGMNASRDIADVQQFSAQEVKWYAGGSGLIQNAGTILSTQPTGSTSLPPLPDDQRFQNLSTGFIWQPRASDIALNGVNVNLNVPGIGQHLGGWDRVRVVVEYWTTGSTVTSGVRETTTTDRSAQTVVVALGIPAALGNLNVTYRVSVYFQYPIMPEVLVAQGQFGGVLAWEEVTNIPDGEGGYTVDVQQRYAAPTAIDGNFQTFDINALRAATASSNFALRQDTAGADIVSSWVNWEALSDGEGGYTGLRVNGVTVRVPTPSFNETFGSFSYARVYVDYYLSNVVSSTGEAIIYDPNATDVWIPINAVGGAIDTTFSYTVRVVYYYANTAQELQLGTRNVNGAILTLGSHQEPDGEGGYTTITDYYFAAPGSFDQSFYTNVANLTIFTGNADTVNADTVYFYYRTSTAANYSSFALPRAALSPGGGITSGLFYLSTGWLPAGVVDYKLVYMQAGAVTATFNGSSIGATAGLQSASRSQAGSVFFADGAIHFFDQTTNRLAVQYRRSGTADAWGQVELGRYAGIANWFSWSHGLSGAYDLRILRLSDAGVTARTFTQVNFGVASATPLAPYAEGDIQVGGQPANANSMTFRYRPAGSGGAWSVGAMAYRGGGVFGWNSESANLLPVVTAGSVYDYEYQYDTYDIGGLLVNAAYGTFRVTPNAKSFLSHTSTRQPTLISFAIEQTGARRLDLQYRAAGSTGAFINAPSMTRTGTGPFTWDASAITPASGSADFEYVYRLYDSAGNPVRNPLGDPIVVTGNVTLGQISTEEISVGWVITGTEATGDIINRYQGYNAFGEVATETDGRSNVTDYAYNTMGALTQRQQPTTDVTGENGVTTRSRPTTRYYYDRTGRAVATRDANNNLTSQIWNEGSAEAAVATEFRADGGKVTNAHDIFGNLRSRTDPLLRQTRYTYDQLDQLTRVDRPLRAAGEYLAGQAAWDTYEYDSLGNRIASSNVLGRARTYFDSEGRVTRYTSIEGRNTSYTYTYQAGIAGAGGKLVGGWQKATSLYGQRTATEKADVFQRMTWRQDYGGNTFNYTYDYAGWLTAQTSSTGQSLAYDYYANGYLKRQIDNVYRLETKYAYDNNGNRVSELYQRTDVAGAIYAASTAAYDELNRLKLAQDPKYRISYKYDAVGNRRNINSYYNDGLDGSQQVQDYWYRYDAMNRFVTTLGQLSGGAITRGSTGKDILYNAADERVQADYYNAATGQTYRERYTYTADGQLQDMYLRTWNGSAWSAEQLSSKRNNDLAGRVVAYQDWTNAGALRTNLARTFDRDHRQLSEVDYTLPSGASYKTDTHVYNADGSLNRIDTSNVATPTTRSYTYQWWDSAKQIEVKVKAFNQALPDWAPGTSKLSYDLNGNLYRATDVAGKRTIQYVTDGDGQILYRQELAARAGVPADWNPTSLEAVGGDIARRRTYYYLNGYRIGDVSNDGQYPSQVDYAEALAQQRPVSNDQRNKKFTPSAYANFDENYQPINEAYPGTAPFEYTVARNDTLSSIAARIWGDRNLWWIIADANGLSGAETLTEGMRLTIPNKVTNIHNNAGTFKVYDAGEAIGDTSPTLPDAPPPPQAAAGKKGCGAIGTLLIIVVAVVATIFTAGAAATLLAGGTLTGAGATFGAGLTALGGGAVAGGTIAGSIAGAAIGGAVGSAAGQLTGIAIGQQDNFSWRQVGLSALGAGVTAGLGSAVQGSSTIAQFAQANRYAFAAANGATNTLITQGVGSALGASSFSWRAVATSALAAPAGMYIGEQVAGLVGPALNGLPPQLQSTLTQGIEGTARAAVAQGIRMQVYNRGQIDWSTLALDAFGNAIGNGVVGGLSDTSTSAGTGSGIRFTEEQVASFGPRFGSERDEFPSLNYSLLGANDAAPRLNAGTAPDHNPVQAAPQTYAVQRGDTLSGISKQFYDNPQFFTAIMAANGLNYSDLRRLQVGRELVIPDPTRINAEVASSAAASIYQRDAAAAEAAALTEIARESRAMAQRAYSEVTARQTTAASVMTTETASALPPIENLYTPFRGLFSTRYEQAIAGMVDSNSNWVDRVVYGALAAGTALPAAIDMMGEALLNSPNAAARGGQLLARADLSTDVDTKVTSRLAAMGELANAFTGAVGPFAGVGFPNAVLTAEQRALQGFSGAEAAGQARATYQASANANFGVDIVADIGASKAAAFTDPRFGRVTPGLYYQAQRWGQSGRGEFYMPVRPVDSLDAEIMGNIRKWGNNAEQLTTVEILPGLQTWKGGVTGGTGQQLIIPSRMQSTYVRPVSTEQLFIDELKFINRSSGPK